MWRVKSCCCGLPLRGGLLVFTYVVIVINYVTLLGLLFKLNDMFDTKHHFDPAGAFSLSLGFALSLVQFAYNIVFLSALHKKNPGLIEHYYHFMAVMLVMQAAVAAFYIPLVVYQQYPLLGYDVVRLFLVMIITGAAVLAFNLYVVVLAYSVMSEMREDRQADAEEGAAAEAGRSAPLAQQDKECGQA